MINTIVVDKTTNSKEVIARYLGDIEGVNCVNIYNEFSQIDCNLKEIGLIIFDIDIENSDTILSEVKKLKNKYKNLDFIAVSYDVKSELVSKVLKEDVAEFLIKPIIPNILATAIKKVSDIKNNITTSKAKTISFFSTKGGVGKTSIAQNCAYEIALQSENAVCLLDLSFNFGDIASNLDVEPKYDIQSVINKLEHSDEALALTLCEKYKDSNLYVLTFKDEGLNKKLNPDIIIKLINLLKNIFKYIVIDAPGTIDETTAGILCNSDLIILIGLLNISSIRNMQKSVELFSQLEINPAKIRLLINRYIENSEIKLMDVKKTVGLEVFFKIPNNYLTLVDAMNQAKTVSETNPHSNIAKAYAGLADEILAIDFVNLEDRAKSGYNHGIFNLLRRMGE